MSNQYVVLIRHGQSEWNKQNRFTGWTDVDLSEEGLKEACRAGEQLKQKGIYFDQAFTSDLKRAQKTLTIILEKMNLASIPVTKTQALKERNYGKLQGQNRQEVIKEYGKDQVQIWRRSFLTSPPQGESLKDTMDRVIPFWEENIFPYIKRGQSVIIAAHGNSLRALIKFLDKIPDKSISELNIPTATPIIYSFDQKTSRLAKI